MKKAGMGWRLAVFVLVWMLALGWLSASVVKAEGDSGCSVDPGGAYCNRDTEGCTGDCNSNSGGGASYQCDPGKKYEIITNKTYVGNGCLVTVGYGNQCDGIYHYESYIDTSDGSCSMSQTSYQKPVCEKMSWTTTGLQCDSTCFGVDLSARVAFPGFCIDVEPYPVTVIGENGKVIRNL